MGLRRNKPLEKYQSGDNFLISVNSRITMSNYNKFLIMLGCSFVIMYAVMFLNVASLSHVYLSTTRAYMSILMVAPMALLMILMMGSMYKDKKKNMVIFLVAGVVFILALVGLRTQTPVGDEQYMKAMIPHHSSAILTSQEADIQDPEVRELADQIIETQIREINAMKEILKRMEEK